MLMFVVAGALLMAGCAGPGRTDQPVDPGQPAPPTESTTADPTTSPPAAAPTPTVSSSRPRLTASPQPNPTEGNHVDVPDTLMNQIRADAAQRAKVSPAQVQVVSSTAQTWNDGSLGCPRPGEFYTQVMVDGYQVIARAGGRTYDYRTSHNGIRLCEK